MKRISFIVLAALVVTSGVAEAHSYYSYSGYDYNQVRWSIYTHSLIPGDLYYSPYAYGYGQSGLVPYWVRYSPYAFGLSHSSGLVNDYATSPTSSCSIYYRPDEYGYRSPGWNAYHYETAHQGNDGSNAEQRQASYAACVQARRDRIRERQQERQQERVTAGAGGDQIVAAYLKSRNIDFRTNRSLQIDGKTISADFELAGTNLIVKYWDPVAILALDQQAQYRKKAYESYLQSWKQFAGQYQHAGGTIYSIISADSTEILAKLTDCAELNAEVKTYASAQDDDSIAQR
jgi:hypothetical protein